jgi:tRNA pseudouridine32 synthase / 23S rRNA pseudouridine746 synthase
MSRWCSNQLSYAPGEAQEYNPAQMNWIVHLDATCVVVNKPPGLLSVPGRGPDKQDCALTRVQREAPDAQVVHRLDMATSGLLIFGRGPRMQRLLSMAFERRQVHKTYVALVEGGPPGEGGEIDLPLSADWPQRPRQKVDLLHGKPSLTRWQALGREAPGRTRMAFEPLTGRSHQLRVHAAASGWPIVGDCLYGLPEQTRHEPRLLLHATRLSLVHPETGAPVSWDLPPAF